LFLGADGNSFASSIAFKEKLLEETPGERLILIGGSGAASSIDIRRLAEAFDAHPVSMGVFAGLGMRYVVNQSIDSVRAGDIVILAPEYEMLQQRATGDGFMLLEMLHANPQELPEVLTPRGIMVMTRAFPRWLRFVVERSIDDALERMGVRTPTELESFYTLKNVTQDGELDVTRLSPDIHLTTADIAPLADGFVVERMNPRVKPYISALFAQADRVGARAYLVMPTLPRATFEANREHAHTQYEELVALVGQERLIGTPDSYVFEDSLYLDSIAHLTATGRSERTTRILTQAATMGIIAGE
jgi:hypothetical protein